MVSYNRVQDNFNPPLEWGIHFPLDLTFSPDYCDLDSFSSWSILYKLIQPVSLWYCFTQCTYTPIVLNVSNLVWSGRVYLALPCPLTPTRGRRMGWCINWKCQFAITLLSLVWLPNLSFLMWTDWSFSVSHNSNIFALDTQAEMPGLNWFIICFNSY